MSRWWVIECLGVSGSDELSEVTRLFRPVLTVLTGEGPLSTVHCVDVGGRAPFQADECGQWEHEYRTAAEPSVSG